MSTPTNYDIFNGDADGICALHQLRLQHPQQSTLISGLKREINLLDQIQPKPGDKLTVLDVSLDKNRTGVERAITAGANIFYADHHYAGDLPLENQFPQIVGCQEGEYQFLIDTTPDTCTSLIINNYLEGAEQAWAVVGAYGDNFYESAQRAAEPLDLSETQLRQLKELGTCLNYNGYGFTQDDLTYHPADLYRLLAAYRDPFEFIAEEEAYLELVSAYQTDLEQAETCKPEYSDHQTALYVLPNQKWARRVSGVFGNQLAQNSPQRAHAVLVATDDGDYRVSVRAPLVTKMGADELCRQFDTGGGRQAAAGINHLSQHELGRFAKLFAQQFN